MKFQSDQTPGVGQYNRELPALCILVDTFAAAMKKRLAEKLSEGYTGWDNPNRSAHELDLDLVCAAQKEGKDQEVDIANCCAILWNRRNADGEFEE